MNIKTLVSIISDVSSGSTVPLNSLEVLTSPWPHGCSNTDSELVALLVSKDVRSSCPSSNGSGSRVEEEPLSVVFRVVVSDSKTELVSSNMLIPEECSVVSHSALDLELDSISKWLRWISDSLEVMYHAWLRPLWQGQKVVHWLLTFLPLQTSMHWLIGFLMFCLLPPWKNTF